jgi:uncharacterized protein YxeA
MVLSLNSLAENLNKKYKISIAAERKNVKQLEKQREIAVSRYNQYKSELDSIAQQKSILEQREATLKMQLNFAFKDLSQANQVLQNMALSGAKEVRFKDEDTAYIKDGKEMKVEFDENGNLRMSPFRVRKRKDVQHIEDMPNGEIPNQDLTEARDMIKNLPSNEGMEVAPNYLEHL